MKQFVKRVWSAEAFRYLFFGACTTGVNLAVFFLLRYVSDMSLDMANFISIIAAVIFAFFVNRWLVFRKGTESVGEIILEFVNFAGMRAGTLGIEFFGVMILNRWTGFSDFISKVAIQAVVIVLNYVISKFVIFERQAGRRSVNE